MKILIHTMYFLPDMGSAPILMDELAASLAARGHRVEIITTTPRPPHNRGYEGKLFVRETRNGVKVTRFPTNFTVHPIGRLIAWSIYTLATFWHLRTVRRGDVVFLRLPPLQLGLTGILARVLCGASVILNVQDIHPDLSIEAGILRNPLAIRIARAFEKWIYNGHDRIVVISDGFRKNLLAKGVPEDKISIIPNWVDTDFIRPLPKDNPVSRRHGLHDVFSVMYSGTISISSFETLTRILEAARFLANDPGIRIVIVGDGLKLSDLRARADALRLGNVDFLPFQPYADLPDLLASADGLMVPLDKDKSFLSVPSKLYNFLAAGRPILGLATESSEVFQIIRDAECGLCAPPDDPVRIAAAIRALKEAPDRRAEMAANGRRLAEDMYSRRSVVDAFEKIMESASRGPGSLR
ncbi:MAG: glycosyltransferase family 4 protein [Candidatus Aminicenantes bacterium]|nr:glycosyltransferase family 4 protein [Candidatus Aminicenantes bacterium]